LFEELPGSDVAARRVEAFMPELPLDRVTWRVIGCGSRGESGA